MKLNKLEARGIITSKRYSSVQLSNRVEKYLSRMNDSFNNSAFHS